MNKKVWAHELHVGGTVDNEAWATLNGDATWTLEEDVSVVGFQLHTDICSFTQVDGILAIYNTLYKGPISEVNHRLGRIETIEEWRSLLGAQEARFIVNPTIFVWLPSDCAFSLIEGDTMVLTTWVQTSAAAHSIVASCTAQVFYTREKVA